METYSKGQIKDLLLLPVFHGTIKDCPKEKGPVVKGLGMGHRPVRYIDVAFYFPGSVEPALSGTYLKF